MKSGDGKVQFFSTGGEIFKAVFIHKNVDSTIQVLAQHVLAQFALSQSVILSP